MKVLEIKKHVLVLDQRQLSQIKGGTSDSDSTDIIIMDDVDAV